MYISLWENSRGHPDNVSFMQFSTKIDGFEQKDSQGFENSYNSYEQYPLEKFFIFTIYQNYTLALKIIWSTCSMTWTAYEPLILCLSCDEWSCGTYQNCWKEWNALIRQRCCRKSRYCQSTDTERHMWDSINFSIFAEWRTQHFLSCFNFKFYKY